MIRHGEKTTGKTGELSAAGVARAKKLIGVFNGTKLCMPKALFAGHYAPKTHQSQRTLHTLQPLATKLGLKIDNSHDNYSGQNSAASAIKKTLKTEGVILVCWEHHSMCHLCDFLGLEDFKYDVWSNDDFDSVYVLKFEDGLNQPPSFTHKHESV